MQGTTLVKLELVLVIWTLRSKLSRFVFVSHTAFEYLPPVFDIIVLITNYHCNPDDANYPNNTNTRCVPLLRTATRILAPTIWCPNNLILITNNHSNPSNSNRPTNPNYTNSAHRYSNTLLPRCVPLDSLYGLMFHFSVYWRWPLAVIGKNVSQKII